MSGDAHESVKILSQAHGDTDADIAMRREGMRVTAGRAVKRMGIDINLIA